MKQIMRVAVIAVLATAINLGWHAFSEATWSAWGWFLVAVLSLPAALAAAGENGA
nr:hypothetical protein [uncultured Cupriavidus sp.]